MNLDLIKQKLGDLENSQTKQKSFSDEPSIFWKPDAGSTQIRLLPNPYNRDYPFSELLFYYKFGKTMISPKSFQQEDFVYDVIQKMRRSKDEAERKVAYNIEPKMRTYCMVLVRGKENEGPKYWGFGKTIYQELLGIIADPDYGDITDLTTGRDVTVEFTPAKGEGTFPKTSIRVKPNPTKAFDDQSLVEKIKNLKPISEVWKVPTEQELKDALAEYFGEKPAEKPAPESKTRQEPSDSDFDVSKLEVPGSKPDESIETKTINKDVMADIDAMFDEFNR